MQTAKPPHASKVLLGLSGNMLSSVVGALLKHQGFQVVAIHFETDAKSREEAERIAQKLGIPLIVENVVPLVEAYVIDHVVHQVAGNRQAEPMLMAHQKILIDRLCAKAEELHCDKISTGHAARVALDPSTGLTRLLRASDAASDQSHLLFGLRAQDLNRFILPIGDLGPAAIERIAIELELDPLRLMNPPPGFCAIPESSYLELAEPRIPQSFKITGQVKLTDGTVIADHQALYRFTLGQSDGFPQTHMSLDGLSVVATNTATQTVTLGTEDLLMKNELTVGEVNWIQKIDPIHGVMCDALMGPGKFVKCRVVPFDHGFLQIQFAQAQRNVAPGKGIVFYAGDEVLGGAFAI